jgi:tetraacyldisaccharide 4'-kinase
VPLVTPSFWRQRTLIAHILRPVSWIYTSISLLRRQLIHAHTAPLPVIAVGNILAGGAGKTPVAIAIGTALLHKGVKIAFVTRGYGGTHKGPLLINQHSYQDVGDEALLLSKIAPTIVARRRLEGVRLALSIGAELVILDDGLHHPYMKHDLRILVYDGAIGLGNGLLLPAGPLRESWPSMLARIDSIILLGENTLPACEQTPVINADICPSHTPQGRLLAFAGIAYPEKFFNTLHRLPAQLVDTIAFPDHHPYTDKDMQRLLTKATAMNASLITTEKDAVRLPPAMQSHVLTLPIHVRFKQPKQLETLLQPFITETHA